MTWGCFVLQTGGRGAYENRALPLGGLLVVVHVVTRRGALVALRTLRADEVVECRSIGVAFSEGWPTQEARQ